ncbi:MAG: class II fumarate hydratase [Desulfobacterium sp.]|nr:class II fumarate hydratase [Desulfobacterium sp.]
MDDENVRNERDSMGVVRVPKTAYYGANTQRAVENFPISGIGFQPPFIGMLALVKKVAAGVNFRLGLLDEQVSTAIVTASRDVMAGTLDDQFVVDIFQTGSGTSTNMNMNEVIATRANEILVGEKKGKSPVHPNDHVNLGQSSNDVIPSVIHMAARVEIGNRLVPGLEKLFTALSEKADLFSDVKKIGRTHLQDAVPMTLGQEFSGYARQVELGIVRMKTASKHLASLALGGTAVGTGVNTHSAFAQQVIQAISEETGYSFCEAANHFEAQGAQDAAVEASGALKTVAVSLLKIANDIRWLGSGPRAGLGEINLPGLQPGSSIMPGKVNPVIPEAVIQVAAQVMGNDTTITIGAQAGFFELNTMLPVIGYNLLQSIGLLATAAEVFAEKCIGGITANRAVCESNIEKSLAMATYLVPHVGYDRAAAIAKRAFETGKTVREIALAEEKLPESFLPNLDKP